MPITRVLLKSGCGSPQNTPALTVQPAQLLSSGSVPAQQSVSLFQLQGLCTFSIGLMYTYMYCATAQNMLYLDNI